MYNKPNCMISREIFLSSYLFVLIHVPLVPIRILIWIFLPLFLLLFKLLLWIAVSAICIPIFIAYYLKAWISLRNLSLCKVVPARLKIFDLFDFSISINLLAEKYSVHEFIWFWSFLFVCFKWIFHFFV